MTSLLLSEHLGITYRVCYTGLSVESPLKAALTGLELVLARAQIWEESAAKHVSLGPQLEGVAALATRWRRLELSAWRNLLKTTQQRHAAGVQSVCRAFASACRTSASALLK